MSGRIANIQALRGAAILLVLFYHLRLIEETFSPATKLLPDFFHLGGAGVDLFFVISGFVMVTVTRGKFGGPYQVARFLYNRVTRIYPLYWFYSLLLIGNFSLRQSWPQAFEPTPGAIVKSLLLFPQDTVPLLAVGWSLIFELYFYVVFALLMFTREARLNRTLAAWVGLIVFLSTALEGITAQSAALRIFSSPMALEFIAGALIARMSLSNHTRFGSLALFLGVLLFSAGYYLPGSLNLAQTLGYTRVVVFGVPAVLLVYGAVSLELREGKAAPPLLCRIGDVSYSLYLTHLSVLWSMGKLSQVASPVLPGVFCLWLTAMFGAALVVGHLSYLFLELPLMSVARKLPAKLRRFSSAVVTPGNLPHQN